ncbi:MAG: hypothetical protein A3G75_12655 [Verrucomicrobia bacterium RIFCSPLOWO2_12_FULL_64_8]|nr:MAG: hypothetical protein A3G75_12655 [Verrucomicrobia bacterium RIFCSPLOWO2_12_FULL_64_8]
MAARLANVNGPSKVLLGIAALPLMAIGCARHTAERPAPLVAGIIVSESETKVVTPTGSKLPRRTLKDQKAGLPGDMPGQIYSADLIARYQNDVLSRPGRGR